MSPNWMAVAVMPLVVVLVILIECSRLHSARVFQRRLGRQATEMVAPASAQSLEAEVWPDLSATAAFLISEDETFCEQS